MSQSDKEAIRKFMAELYGPEQQVPPGNPIAEHYQGRADDLNTAAGASAIGGGVLGGLSLAELLEGNPLALLGLLGAGGMAATGGAAGDLAKTRQGTADMWANRFGANDGRQGMPGTPSGPAYRRGK